MHSPLANQCILFEILPCCIVIGPNTPAYIALGSSGDVIDDVIDDDQRDWVMKGFPPNNIKTQDNSWINQE